MGGGVAMVILENNSLPSNIKKMNQYNKSLPLEGTNICVPLLYGHIFSIGLDLGPYSDLFH